MAPFRRRDDGETLGTLPVGVLGKEAFSRLQAQTVQVLRDDVGTLRRGWLYDDSGFPALADHDVRSVVIPLQIPEPKQPSKARLSFYRFAAPCPP